MIDFVSASMSKAIEGISMSGPRCALDFHLHFFFFFSYVISLLRRFPIETPAENSCILSVRVLALDASTQ